MYNILSLKKIRVFDASRKYSNQSQMRGNYMSSENVIRAFHVLLTVHRATDNCREREL